MSHLIQSLGVSSNSVQLICFPFAGGYSASFRPMLPHLQDCCDLLAAEPPGHGTNRMPLTESLEELIDLYLSDLMPKLRKPFVLFGHSMGGLAVYRLAQRLERRGIFADAVIISGAQPPHIRRKTVTHLDDEAFLNHVIGLGGIPPELVEAKALLDYFLPALRADFKALETFEHTDHSVLQSPVHIFNGIQDEQCIRDAPGWKACAPRLRFHTFRGGHMYLLSETEKVASTIRYVVSLLSTRMELIEV